MGAVLFVAAGILFAPVATRQLGDTDAEDAQIPSVTDGGDGIDQIPFCDPVQINQHQRHELVRRVHMQLKINLARHRHKVRQKRGTLGSYSKIWNQIPMKMDGKIYYMVPYTVQYDYDQKSFAVLEEIIAAIEKATCIRFDRIVDERKQQFYRTDDYIAIVNGKGCHSVIGRHSGKNLLTLEVSEKIGTPKKWHRNTCMKRRIVLHELLHVLGLHHEHQRKDRDKFLEVVMANVKKGKEGNFEIERDHESWGFPYDFESIMNYKYNQFALEASKPVIKVRKGTPLCQSLLGTHQHASEMDFLLVNMLYNCVGVEQAVNAFIDRHFPAKPHHNHHHKHKAALRKLETEIKHIEAMMARLERSRSTHHRHRHRSKIQKIEAKLARLESRKKTQKHSQKLQKMEAKLTLEKKTQGKGGKSKQQQAKNGDKSRPQKAFGAARGRRQFQGAEPRNMTSGAVAIDPKEVGGIAFDSPESLPPTDTTTTISTIAVRAEPHSTIVVALLKSIGFVELRIDKMRPGLLEIGSDPRENSHLLGIHDDLFRRLLGKQQQVEELLGRAEKLVQEQTEPSDMIVYEAMADGLAAAWRGLSRQLAMRGFILADTQRLYELALKHEELAKLANSKLQHINVAKEGHTPEMGPIVNELAELTRDGLEIGSDVITQIRLLGSLNDNAQRPRETLDACLAIEKVMLSMAQSWEFVERIRRERGLHAQDAAQLGQVQYQRIQQNGHKKVQQNGKSVIRHEIENLSQFERKTGKDHEAHLDAAEQWLHTGQQRFLLIRRGGEQEEQEDEELELSVLANETRANQASLKALDEQQLAHPLGTRCAELLERYSRFLKEVQQREELLERSAVMLRGSDMLISQLAKMRDELHNADAPMAGELGPLAQQKGIALIEEGGILVKSWESEGGSGQWKEHILERVERLKEAVIEVVQLARERIAAGKAEKLREKLGLLEQWLHTVARPLLSEPVQLGPGAAETSEFLSRHRRFSTDLSAREHEMRSLLSAQQKSQPLDTGEEQRLDNVHKGVGRVRQMLDTRIRLAQQLEQSLKLDRELDTSLHFLATLLQQKANQSAPQPRYQMRNLLQQTNEHIYRERHEAEKFADLAGGLTNERLDPNLALRPALEWSKEKLASHEQEFNRLSQMCEQWEEGKDRRRDGATAKGVPPRIVFPLPVEQAVLQGLRLELSARVEGQPEPQVRWLKDADVLAERIGHCRMDWLNGTATLVIEEVLAEDEGDYTLQAANGLGQTETKCRLIVQEVPRGMLQKGKHQLGTQSAGEPQPMDSGSVPQPTPGESKPRFVRQLESVSVPEGASFLLDCVVVGDPEPKIIWYREEQTVRESDHVRLHFRGDHCSLHCEDAHGEDAGLYKVLAVNRHGETMNFCRVCIIPPSPKRSRVPPPTPPKPATPIQARRVSIPSIVPQPARIESQLCSQVAREGEPAQFQTQLRGWPVPEVHWLHNGQPIVAANRSDLSITTDIGEAVATVALRIPNVSLDHAGQYTLLARNEHAEVRSSATLNVLLDVVSGTAAEVDPFDLWLQKQGGQQRPKQQSQSPVKLTHSDLFLSQSPTKLQFPSQPQSPTKSFAAHQFGLQSPSSVGYEQIHQRWQQTHFGASQSPHQGVVYAVTKSDRAESRRSSDFGDPVYSSIAKAPEFIRAFQPEVTVIEGQNAEIDCLMVANPRPKVQWFFNDGLIRACPDFVEFSNIGDTYAVHFRAAPLECAGYYRLVAENVRGKADSQVLVHVRPKSMVAQPGHRRSLGGGPGGVQALLKQQRERQWAQLYQHRAVSTPPRPPASSCGSGSALASPLPPFAGVPATTAMSTSVYAAELERELFAFPKQQQQHSPRDAQQQGKSSAAFQLMETQQQFRRTPPQPKGSPPHFLQTLVSVVVAEGAQAKFEAVVTGLPNPRLEWSKDGRPVVEGGNVRCWTEGGRAALIVESAGRTDTGKYCCTAENQSGMASSSAQLVLRPKAVAPDFEQRLISEELEEGGKMQWTVQTSGEPEPAVRWLRDGAPVQDGQGGVRLIKECPFVYSLSIDPLRLEDGGQFTCVLENTAGEARSTADLMVRRKGSAPGKYVHVTKVSQERQSRAEELLAQSETVTVDESLGTGSLEEEEDGDVDV